MKAKYLVKEFAEANKMRKDWHEPDEQNVTAKVYGNHLDNAFGDSRWMWKENPNSEYIIVLSNTIHTSLVINLANLLADYARLSKAVEEILVKEGKI